MPLSLPGSPGPALEYFGEISLILLDFPDLIKANPPRSRGKSQKPNPKFRINFKTRSTGDFGHMVGQA